MDAGIILGGQTPNILAAMDAGRAMAESQIALNRQNALARLYQGQGAQIAAGDQNALNALAAFDPNAALGVQDVRLGMDQTRLQMDATKQSMAINAEDLAMRRENARREAEAALREQAATLSAEQLAQEQQALSEALSGGAFFYQNKDKAGYDAFLASKGIDLAEFPFEAFPAHAASVEGVLEAMRTFAPPEAPSPIDGAPKGFMFTDPSNPAAGVAPLPGYTPTPDTVINNNAGGGSDKQVFDTVAASNERAASALVGLNGLTEAAKALEGGAITGFAADQRLYLAKLGNYLGITDPAAVENTETFRAAIAPQVAAMIKATVGSANISNSDREFAEKAAAGSIQLDEASIKRMIGIMDKMGREAIRIHNEKVDKVYPPGKGFDRERALFIIPAPAGAAGGSGSPGQAFDQSEIDALMAGP